MITELAVLCASEAASSENRDGSVAALCNPLDDLLRSRDDVAAWERSPRIVDRSIHHAGVAPVSSVSGRDRVLVTGATGLLGSHLAERLTAEGCRVRRLVRHSSRTDFLDSLGVNVVRGDLTDPAACATALKDVGLVFHCAAKVGDWGTWREIERGCMDATAHARAGGAAPAWIASFTSAPRAPTAIRPNTDRPST